jgi:hypothetical protein
MGFRQKRREELWSLLCPRSTFVGDPFVLNWTSMLPTNVFALCLALGWVLLEALNLDAGGQTTTSIGDVLRYHFALHLDDAKMRVEQAAKQIVWKRNARNRIVPHDNAGSCLARVVVRNCAAQLCFARIDVAIGICMDLVYQ